MSLKSKPLRYAHAEGHTDLCYTEDGKNIITCGHDGDVRVWVGIEDDDPVSHCVGERAISVCFRDNRVFVSNESNAVQAYTFPGFDKDGIVSRFTASVNHITTSSKIEVIACASEGMEARLCSPEGGAPIMKMAEHKGTVLSISLCRNMKYAATSCGDGLLRVWDIDTQKVVKDISCVPKINSFYSAKCLCRTSFEPTEGKYLAHPANREIIVLDLDSWNNSMVFTHSSIKCPISQCLYSPCGNFLAGSTVAGQIAVWNVETGDCLGVIEHPTSHNVTAMAWNPRGNGMLAYCDNSGQLGIIENCNGEKIAEENGDDIEMIERADDLIDELLNFASDDDDNAISIEKLKNETLRNVDDVESRPVSRQTTVRAAAHTVAPQSAFQPASTPIGLEHRYMCWNDVGIVRNHTAANGDSSIEVEFHDTNTHHGILLNNYLNHTMASLSNTVLALACETPSKLVCISLQGSSKEWSVSMSDTEEIVCVIASSGLVACATTLRYLRIFTTMGTQRQVISLAGPAVTLAGYGSTLMVVYHQTDPGVSDQHLAMDIIACNGQQVRSKTVPIPLSPSSKLAWLGPSDSGSPCSYDSDGCLRLYNVTSGLWLPIANTRDHCRGASDTWFIISVSEIQQCVRGILCRGASFPLTVPKPTVAQIPIQMPLCEMDTEKGQYEEQLVRWSLTSTEIDEKTIRETALKLFALACRNEIEQRALELMDLLRDTRLLPLAAKYASRLGRIHLADKLTNLSEEWEKHTDEQLNEALTFQEIETQDGLNENSEDFNTSLIIPQKAAAKKTETVTPIKPVPLKAMSGGRNPFKKQTPATKGAPSPLSLTERTLVDVHSQAESSENTDPMKPKEGETFVDWYSRNKSVLEEENPELTPGELTKQSIKTFRAFQTNVTTNGDVNGKRKSPDSENKAEGLITSAPKQSKLSAFAFQKKTDN